LTVIPPLPLEQAKEAVVRAVVGSSSQQSAASIQPLPI